MKNTDPDDLHDFLIRRPPTPEQADTLAAEELSGEARETVFAILAYWREAVEDR